MIDDNLPTLSGFAAIANPAARVLILGSMPGAISLQEQRYYAHPRNSFWFIIEQLFSEQPLVDYVHKKQLLLENNIALWDVLKHCVRSGSLDNAIVSETVAANDFEVFFQQHRHIRTVFFNGARAEKEYNKHVFPLSGIRALDLAYRRLPSTSPAHAAMSREQKLQVWRVVKDTLLRA